MNENYNQYKEQSMDKISTIYEKVNDNITQVKEKQFAPKCLTKLYKFELRDLSDVHSY